MLSNTTGSGIHRYRLKIQNDPWSRPGSETRGQEKVMGQWGLGRSESQSARQDCFVQAVCESGGKGRAGSTRVTRAQQRMATDERLSHIERRTGRRGSDRNSTGKETCKQQGQQGQDKELHVRRASQSGSLLLLLAGSAEADRLNDCRV